MSTEPALVPSAPPTTCCAPVQGEAMDPETLANLEADLEILAHPVRLRLLSVLARAGGQVCVCDLESVVPVKQPTVSHHLKRLREAGLVGSEKRGLWTFHSVRQDALHALRERLTTGLSLLEE
jgi:ArsR family transcriptional regulator, arsenate/arsenite/antimonite-responsive transcriptional repressor